LLGLFENEKRTAIHLLAVKNKLRDAES